MIVNIVAGIPSQYASKDFHEKAPAISFKKFIVGNNSIIAEYSHLNGAVNPIKNTFIISKNIFLL